MTKKGLMVLVCCGFCNKIKVIVVGEFNRNKSGMFYCNAKCLGQWRKIYKSGQKSPNYKGKIKSKCSYCGKDIEYSPCFKKHNNHFCNTKCQGEWQAKNWLGCNSPIYNRVKTNCAFCGTKLFLPQNQFDRSKNNFCGSSCRGEWQVKNLLGENNPNWKGGLSFEDYPKEFNNTLKEYIRERDAYTCQLCGCLQNERKLDVHHIDYDKNNISEENLVSLCKNNGCHTATNHNRNFWREHLKIYVIDKYYSKYNILNP